MTAPLHQYASVALGRPAEAIVARLIRDPQATVASATASSLARLDPLWRAWGLVPNTLPDVDARATSDGEVGTIDLTWSGDENTTAWPALAARLLIVPEGSGGSRIALVSSRSPRARMLPGRIDPFLSDRVLQVSVQAFLRDLASQLSGDRPILEPAVGVTHFVREPLFVHHRQPLDGAAAALTARLLADANDLAVHATATAVERARDVLAAGRFRRPANPAVTVEPTSPGELGVLDLTWTSDEEATGWPALTLALIIEARHRRAQLVVASRREPGYDLSVNRVDKHERDRIIRQAGPSVADAISARIHIEYHETPAGPAPSSETDSRSGAPLPSGSGR